MCVLHYRPFPRFIFPGSAGTFKKVPAFFRYTLLQSSPPETMLMSKHNNFHKYFPTSVAKFMQNISYLQKKTTKNKQKQTKTDVKIQLSMLIKCTTLNATMIFFCHQNQCVYIISGDLNPWNYGMLIIYKDLNSMQDC